MEKCPICSSKSWGLQRAGCEDLRSNEASQARHTPVEATTPVALHLVLPGIYTLVSTENHSEEGGSRGKGTPVSSGGQRSED